VQKARIFLRCTLIMFKSNSLPNSAAKSLLIFLLTCSAPALRPCDVPVFRYALERWPVETYEVALYHQRPLSGRESEAVETLRSHSRQFLTYSNFTFREIDLTLQPELKPQALQISSETSGLPYLVVYYPGYLGEKRIIWSGPLSSNSVRGIIDSPTRREIAGRILGGETGVWVLLESGDRAKDNAAESTIKETLTVMEKKLKLPDAVTGAAPKGAPDLRIDFSLVRLSRSDPQEEFLVRMLARSESDLEQYQSQPMAFPVYGRGRVLYALVSQGITRDNVAEACVFLAGPCACEIKDSNPGTDLLILADWDKDLGGSWVDAVAIPPPVTLASLARASRTWEFNSKAGNSKYRLYRNIFLALGLVVSVIVLVSFKMLKSGRGDN